MRNSLAIVFGCMFGLASVGISAHADIYQWEYINPADPSQGKQQSTTLAPDGAGVDAVPGAQLGGFNLTMAYLSQTDLTGASFYAATLTDADFTDANVRQANFGIHPGSCSGHACFWPLGTGISLEQIYSTASYQFRDLSGIALSYNNLVGGNFANQNLADAQFFLAALAGADFGDANLVNTNLVADLRNTNLHGANLANAVFAFELLPCSIFNCRYADLTGADLSAADARGAFGLYVSDATTTNLIWPDGHIHGISLDAGGFLVVRDYDGSNSLPPIEPIPITIDQHLAMSPGGTLRMVFEADAWDSTISFVAGIPVTLGGTLELTFADDVNPASQLGRTFDLFDWTGVTPAGAFAVDSPYRWDVSNLYTTGEVTLAGVPEPCNLVSAYLALAVLVTTGRLRLGQHNEKSRRRWTLVQNQTRLPMLTLIAVNLSVASSFAAPTIIDRDHFTNRFAPNSVPGTPVGNNVQISAVLNSLDPVGGTTISVQAIQGDSVVTLNYIGHHHPLFEGVHLYYAFIPFDSSLTGPWQIVASDSSGTAASVFTNAIPDPQFVPYASNIVVQATSSTASVSWTLPSLDGFDVDVSAVRIFDATSGGIVFQSPVLPIQTTTYQAPLGVLQSGAQYVYNVILSDDEVFGHENASWGFSDPFRLTLPGDYNQDGVVDAADYVVWRKTDGGQAGYDNWRKNFGNNIGSGASQSANVPEPSAFLLVTVSLVGVVCCYPVRRRPIPALQFIRATIPLVAVAADVRADIYQWEYINPADPSQGKQQSTTLAPGGAGVNAVPGANLFNRNLTRAYLVGADLTGTDGKYANLTNADLSQANLTNANFGAANLTGANFRHANLANASFQSHRARVCDFGGSCFSVYDYALLTGADLTAADARGGFGLQIAFETTSNLIWQNGHINGLDLDAGGLLVVRDYEGPWYDPARVIPINVDQHFAMAPGGTLRMMFEADAWDSTIFFAPGIPVALGGTLELMFADDVNPATQLGRTFDLFDWTGVTPTGKFDVVSPYRWDTSKLYSIGDVRLLGVPEPRPLVTVGVCVLAIVSMRRSRPSMMGRVIQVVRRLFPLVAYSCAIRPDILSWHSGAIHEVLRDEAEAIMGRG
jgi:uncharacterized protein YjbI with pentapeptide repeats